MFSKSTLQEKVSFNDMLKEPNYRAESEQNRETGLFFIKVGQNFSLRARKRQKKQKNGVPSVRRSPKTNEKKYG